MGAFLRENRTNQRIKISAPGTVRPHEEFAMYLTNEAQETRRISVHIGSETMLEITPDGFIELNIAALAASPYVRFVKE